MPKYTFEIKSEQEPGACGTSTYETELLSQAFEAFMNDQMPYTCNGDQIIITVHDEPVVGYEDSNGLAYCTECWLDKYEKSANTLFKTSEFDPGGLVCTDCGTEIAPTEESKEESP